MIRNRTSYICLLSDNDIANGFCLRYWAMSPTGKWNESFQTLLSDSGFNKPEMIDMLKSACRLYIPHIRCPRCGCQISVATRSEYSAIIGKIKRFGKASISPLCTFCSAVAIGAEHRSDFVLPKNRQDRVAEALKRLHEKAKRVDYDKLGFFQSCLLYAALLAANLAPEQSIVPPLGIQTDELAPTPELADQIYSRLCTDGIFLPALSSDLNAFSLDKETGAVTVDIRAAAWTLADDAFGRSIDDIFKVLFQRLDQPEPEAVEALWYLVAEDECRRYFVSQWERYKFAHASIYSAKLSAAVQHYWTSPAPVDISDL